MVTCFKLFMLLVVCLTSTRADNWSRGTATFYGGSDASGTMGGACGYGNLYVTGYGVSTAALSTVLFNDGASCGQCFLIVCDYSSDLQWCLPGKAVTITATNLCPPNWALANDDGGWCNPPRPHFDMAQPAWEQSESIGQGSYRSSTRGKVKCWRQGGIRFTINGFNFFELILVTNVAGSGSIQSMSVKGSNTGWIPMYRNWGANWQSNAGLIGQALSFSVTSTGGQNLMINNVVPAGWRFGQSFMSYWQFGI